MTCEFQAMYGTHADMNGAGVATCCDIGPVEWVDGRAVPASREVS